MAELKYWQAINHALHEEMERDSSVVIVGEDVGKPGGTYLATKGLQRQFGESRVRDTPISEGILTGMAAGAAMTGLRPVLEIMFMDFMTLASDQLVNHAAKVSWLSGGAFTVPMVVRTMVGAGRNTGPQHGQSFESWLGHVPGLKVVWPSNAADMKGLLKAAIRDPNPVIVVESLALWSARSAVPDGDHVVPLGQANVVRAGQDVTVVAWGSVVRRAMEAAENLAADGIQAEVVDLRTLSPLDEDAILGSLTRTGRLVIVHDDVGPYGPGAEIAALAVGPGFASLKAPVRRVTAPFAPVPFPPQLEREFFPQVHTIESACRAAVAS